MPPHAKTTHDRVVFRSALVTLVLVPFALCGAVRAESRWELRSMPVTPRARASAAVDTAHGVLYTYGGGHEWNLGTPGVHVYDEQLWAFDLETGAARLVQTTGTAPSTTTLCTILYDDERNQLVFIGERHVMGWRVGGIWFLSLSTFQWSTGPASGANTADVPGTVLDAVRDRLIQWYPDPAVGVWSLPLDGGSWQQLTTGGITPPRLSTRLAALDPGRDRLVVAPEDSAVTTTMLALTLGAQPTWSALDVTGAAPTFHRGHAFWDARHDQLVHVGEWEDWWTSSDFGLRTNVVSSLTFPAASTPTWLTIRPYDANGVDMPARFGSATAFDARTGRALSFGGSVIHSVFSDYGTWIDWSGLASAELQEIAVDAPAVWESVPVGIPLLQRRSAALDPAQHRVLVVSEGATETYEVPVDGSACGSFRALGSSGAPPGLDSYELDLVTDILGDRLILLASRASLPDPFLLVSMPLHGSPQWSLLDATGTPPGARTGSSAVYDPVGNRVVVFGGDSLGVYKNDTYLLSLDGTPQWTRLAGPAPQARRGHVAVYDAAGERMLIHAGRGGNGLRNDTWELALAGTPAWSPVTLFEPLVEIFPRENATAALDALHNRLLVFGGQTSSMTAGDLWELRLDELVNWQQVTPATSEAPTARSEAASAYDPSSGRWLVLGGMTAQSQPIHESWLFWDPTILLGVDDERAPLSLALSSPAPNPSRGSVTFALALPHATGVRLDVFDVGGRLVRSIEPRRYEAGRHTLTWDGRDAVGARPAPGLYFVRVTGAGAQALRRVVLTF